MGVVDVYTHAASPDASMGNMCFPPKELFKSFVIIFLFSQGHHFCVLSVLLMSLCSKMLASLENILLQLSLERKHH